jgi:hypothetical protein
MKKKFVTLSGVSVGMMIFGAVCLAMTVGSLLDDHTVGLSSSDRRLIIPVIAAGIFSLGIGALLRWNVYMNRKNCG